MAKSSLRPRDAVSLATVAASAGVSISTVSRIVNGHTGRASPETVLRVRQAVETLGYRPNQLGQALKHGRSRIDNPVMATIAASTEAALRDAGYVMILCDTHDRAELQDEYLEVMRSQLVQGYVVVAGVASPALARFVEEGAPIVFAARRNPCGAGGPFVGIDNRQAGSDAADYLMRRGITEAAVLHPTEGSSVTRERCDGFVIRFSGRGGTVARGEAPGLSHLEVGYAAARSLADLSPWPRAVMCVSDQIAYGAYRFTHERGIRVPDDCLIVGIDGNDLNQWVAPWLTSVKAPYREFGTHVVELLSLIWSGEHPADRIVPHSLAVADDNQP
jgi:LacI family transcriptional regulator